ncbi:MAG TPA: hypothetical protein QGF35_04390 [Dehalococcoidia bacterium]|nr:hypothetical protein [Dehalococcoidia bacterium]
MSEIKGFFRENALWLLAMVPLGVAVWFSPEVIFWPYIVVCVVIVLLAVGMARGDYT